MRGELEEAAAGRRARRPALLDVWTRLGLETVSRLCELASASTRSSTGTWMSAVEPGDCRRFQVDSRGSADGGVSKRRVERRRCRLRSDTTARAMTERTGRGKKASSTFAPTSIPRSLPRSDHYRKSAGCTGLSRVISISQPFGITFVDRDGHPQPSPATSVSLWQTPASEVDLQTGVHEPRRSERRVALLAHARKLLGDDPRVDVLVLRALVGDR